MAVQYAFSQITTTGLKLAVDAADPLSYPGSGTTWTDVSGNGFTGTISSSISFATTNRGALVSSNSASAVSFSGSAADFGTGSFTIEMTFLPSRISGTHWLYSKNSGSFPNFGAYITGSSGSGRIVAFYNVSSTISSSAATAVGSIVTGSNYVLDVTYIPNRVLTSVYLNSNLVSNAGANGTGSLSTSASLLLLNNTTASNAGTIGNLYNFKVYNPFINSSNIRQNYNSMCSRFGLPLALYTPPVPLLLNAYPGAAIAYSLRLLNENYDGFAIRVRRSSDNTEQNIGFNANGDLDTSSLISFCGAGNGLVTTWYDQSGNSRNLTQSTAASQPQIVSNGSVILQNSKPTIDFSSDVMSTSVFSSIISQPNTYFITVNKSNHTGYLFDSNTVNRQAQGDDTWAFAGTVANDFYPTSQLNKQIILTILFNSTNSISRINGTATGSGNTGTNGIDQLSIGRNSQLLTGKVQEFIMFPTNQTSNYIGIESNINSYYSIY